MYVPSPFGVPDQRVLESFIHRYAFATLVTSSAGAPIVSHIPIMLRRNEGKGSLIGHVARANDHWRELDGSHDSVAIFHGPHAYVSPAWYVTSSAVPTWNYAVVHVCGKPNVSMDPDFTTTALADLVAEYESSRDKPWRVADLAPDVFRKLAGAIVAFEMPIEKIEGKFKLGQNRSREDRLGMLAGLESEGTSDTALLAKFIREHVEDLRGGA
jgi:transcriptional regulator